MMQVKRNAWVLAAAVVAQPAGAQWLDDWDYENLYSQGWSAEEFMDEADVYGPDGEQIGTVENMLINDQGQIVALVAQVGGFWDIADTHIAVPWDRAEVDGYRVEIPVTEEEVEDYSLFKDDYFTRIDVGSLETVDDDLDTGWNIWKATNLIDDYAVFETGAGYGYVSDLIFDSEGMLQSVVVDSSGLYGDAGYYGYPWYGYGYEGYEWDPGLDYYTLPFTEDEISDMGLTAFDYDELEQNGDI